MLDWTGDHIFTNFKGAYMKLRSEGYFVEVLSSDFTCFDAYQYGALLLVDPEDDFFPEEVTKLEKDIIELGLSLVVMGDWYNVASIRDISFFDDNTRSDWSAVTGGANIPALNELLAPYGIAFGDRVFDGVWTNLNHTRVHFLSGVSIARFPAKGWLLSVPHGLKERNVVARKVPRKSKSANETLKQGKDTTNAKSFKRAEAVFPESH